MRLNRGFTKFIYALLVITLLWGCANSNFNTPNLFSSDNNVGSFNTKNYPCDNVYVNASASYDAKIISPFGEGQTNSGYIFGLNITGNSDQSAINYSFNASWGTGNWHNGYGTASGTINNTTLKAGAFLYIFDFINKIIEATKRYRNLINDFKP